MALRIDAQAVGHARLVRHARKDPPAVDRARGQIEVVGPDRAAQRIRVVQHAVVRAPAEAVGQVHVGAHHVHRKIRVETVQRAGALDLRVIHGAGEQAPAPVALAVVETVAGPLGLGIGDRRYVARLRIDPLEAAHECADQAAARAQRHAADALRHDEFTVVAARRFVAEEARVLDVDPPQHLTPIVPDRPLPDQRLRVGDAADPAHRRLVTIGASLPHSRPSLARSNEYDLTSVFGNDQDPSAATERSAGSKGASAGTEQTSPARHFPCRARPRPDSANAGA